MWNFFLFFIFNYELYFTNQTHQRRLSSKTLLSRARNNANNSQRKGEVYKSKLIEKQNNPSLARPSTITFAFQGT